MSQSTIARATAPRLHQLAADIRRVHGPGGTDWELCRRSLHELAADIRAAWYQSKPVDHTDGFPHDDPNPHHDPALADFLKPLKLRAGDTIKVTYFRDGNAGAEVVGDDGRSWAATTLPRWGQTPLDNPDVDRWQHIADRLAQVLLWRSPSPADAQVVADDLDRLALALEAVQGDCQYSDDFTKVTWYGKPYVFTKGKQARIVGELIQDWENGGRGLSVDTLAERADITGQLKLNISATFRLKGGRAGKHPAWGTMIRQDPTRKGFYLLCADR
ncbi:MAG: hypothetical protein IT443_07415 [Phycisphaeraceae bacterium]|nr:hypothetical protein [Phycisphaeraceae bacterium]